jgi:hypothetical protein
MAWTIIDDKQKNISSKDKFIDCLISFLINKYKIIMKNTRPRVIGITQKPQNRLYGAKTINIADSSPILVFTSFFAIRNTNNDPTISIMAIVKYAFLKPISVISATDAVRICVYGKFT